MDAQRDAVLDALAREITQLDLGHPIRVAIDGITGVGKTTFAGELATRIVARPVLSVSMDGFHHPRAVRHRQGRGSPDGYYEDAYDFASLTTELLDPLGAQGSRRYRTAIIDLASDRALDVPRETAPSDLVLVVDGSFLQRDEVATHWDVTVWLDASFEAARARGALRDAELLGSAEQAKTLFRTRYHAAQQRYLDEVGPAERASIVVELEDPAAPVVRSIRGLARFARTPDPALESSRAFFAPRAADWNAKFREDEQPFVEAIRTLGPEPGATVVDVGCGAGRALPLLAAAVGPAGRVVGFDVTPEMVAAARRESPTEGALLLADARRVPLAASSADALLGAGLLRHLPNPLLDLVELARITKPGGRLALFHAISRAAMARMHGQDLRDDDPLAEENLRPILAGSGWALASLDDGADRYLALAVRGAL